MYDLFTRSVERAVLAYGFADSTYPLLRMHREDSRFGPTMARLIGDERIYVTSDPHAGPWYLSPVAMSSLLAHSDTEVHVAKASLQRLTETFRAFASAQGNRLTDTGRLDLTSFDAILFDLGGVIVDESDLDAAICRHFDERLPRRSKWHSYAEYADELERRADTKWYDYFAQARDLGFPESLVDELHQKHVKKVRFFPQAVETLRFLKRQESRVFLVTGCNSRVLERRLELYGIADLFEERYTSDTGGELGNKEPSFTAFLANTGLAPSRILLVTDGYSKDVLPALRLGITPLLFLRGGRHNTAYKSNGVMPGDEIVLSMMATQANTAVNYVFSSFRAFTT